MTRVVGLGASAGGLEPLGHFLSQVPANSGLAYIVVQHLDPTHEAMLTELLQRVTTMPVQEAVNSMPVRPDNVYVIAPNSELTVAGDILQVAKPSKVRGARLPIDALFLSLARDRRDQAIGVVMSGMGSDGTMGLAAIRRQGGLTLAQTPDSAQFDSMPQSAVAAGCVDIIALPGELPQHILRISAPHQAGQAKIFASELGSARDLDSILALLRERNKHDLSMYKPSTLVRRIERRMILHGLATMAAYAAFLRENSQELDLLFAEMLIGVTSFFRDTAVWQELKDSVLPDLLARHPPDKPLRAWVVGCSTGEEAYSLAILFHEIVSALPEAPRRTLQIFASDLSGDAIALARRGRYARTIERDVHPERLERYFSAQDGGYLVQKTLREMVLFAHHDVILDPPFTKLDILSCRNLLIYFNTALQRRLIPLFHYSLHPGGALVLGGSETVGAAQSLFATVSAKSRLYRRNDQAADAGAVEFPINLRWSTRTTNLESRLTPPTPAPPNLQSLADQMLLQEFSPAAVLVNAGGDIVYISGRTGRYLEPAAGRANWNIHVMARPGIRTQLAVALRQATQEGKTVELRGLRVDGDAKWSVDITVRVVQEPKSLAGTTMIVFREVADPTGSTKRRRSGSVDPALGEELLRSREEIRALRDQTQASQEELQASNEELQSTNEELQSANEELTTSKEEAQSMNEELQTVNGELQSKLDDLALAESDMQNLLNSTDIATLFLDNDLNVRRFTERTARVFHLREGDIGRPLSDLATMLSYPQLDADARETLRSLVFCEKQVPTTEGHWFSVRIMPYRTLANVIRGVVITLVDITASKELESRLRKE